ncbi:MAG: flagellar export protein FliJ [Gemmatimonadetes bacterium]|nr:flagellar export protein FliJ [Gemmatimonadota bacterium]
MKRFTFRLERLLQLREAAEQERARELASARHEEEARRNDAEEAARRLEEARRQAAESHAGYMQAGTLRNLELSIGALTVQRQAAAQQHEQSLERLEAERQQYEAARRDRRVIERLREQRHAAWGEEYNRWEQGVLDETASTRSSRASGQGPEQGGA